MKLKNVSHYAIYDQKFDNWKSEVLDRWTYDDFVRDPQYKKKWISITSLAYHQPSDAVYLGIGSFSAELLWKFDRKAKTITSCSNRRIAGRYPRNPPQFTVPYSGRMLPASMPKSLPLPKTGSRPGIRPIRPWKRFPE